MTVADREAPQRLRRVELPADAPGSLWLHSMPGRFESWEEFLADARRAQLSATVCLVPMDEVATVSPVYGRAVEQGQLPFRWIHLPMHNFGISSQADPYRAGIHHVADVLRAGESVLLHCAAGIGRTGAAAACVLKALGSEAATAIQAVHRAGSNPQTAVQSGLIERF